jgi:hypothetical protein
VKLTAPEQVAVTRRWELFDELKKDLQAFGLKPKEDLHDMWRNRTQKATFQVNLEPEFLIRMHFQADYTGGSIELGCNNLDGFGAMKGRLTPELLQTSLFDEIGRFMMGRTNVLPPKLELTRDMSRNL